MRDLLADLGEVPSWVFWVVTVICLVVSVVLLNRDDGHVVGWVLLVIGLGVAVVRTARNFLKDFQDR